MTTKNELIEQIHTTYVDLTTLVLGLHNKEHEKIMSKSQIAETQYHLMAAKMKLILAIDKVKERKNAKSENL